MKSCSFTGHRPEKIWDLKVGRITEEKVKAVIRETVIMLGQDGVRTFYSGMARGTDMWAAEVVIELQKTYHDIELIAVKPFPEQTDMSWPEQEKIKYQDLLSKCTEVKVICPVYEKEAYKKRNQYLVDNCEVLVVVYDPRHSRSGTGQTVRMAEKAKRRILRINPSEIDKQE